MEFAAIEEMIKNAKDNDLGISDSRAFIKDDTFKLKKAKMELSSNFKHINDLCLEFSFNPFTAEDCGFMRSPISPSTTVLTIKRLCRENEQLKEFWDNMSNGAISYDVEDSITEEEFKFFNRFRKPLLFSHRIVKSTLSKHGQYGRKFLSSVVVDKHGNIVEDDLANTLRTLEVAIASADVATMRTKMEAEGKTEKFIKEQVKARFKAIPISNPYKAGIFRGLCIKTENIDGLIKDGDKLEMTGVASYFSGNKSNYEALEERIGSVADKNFDYLETDISYGRGTGDSENEKKLDAYKSATKTSNPPLPINEQIDGFQKKYLEFRDNPDYFNDSVMVRSVFEFRAMDDDLLLEAYKTDLTADKKKALTPQIAASFEDTLAKIDETLTDDLTLLIMSATEGEVIIPENDAMISDAILDSELNEEVEGAGITDLDGFTSDTDIDKLLDKDTEAENKEEQPATV